MRVLLKTYGAMVLAALVVLTGTTRSSAQGVAPPTLSSPVPAPIESQKQSAEAPKPCTLPGISAQLVQEAVDASSMLQPPLAADALIRIATKVASPCPVLAKDLLQRAFDQGDSVEPDTAYKLALGAVSTDSRVYFMKLTYDLGMDRLSLQSRVVISMAPLDAKKAIQLFQRMTPPRPPAVSCTSAFAPDVSIYYEAVGKVFALLKVRKPLDDAEVMAPFLQLQEVARATISPVQLAPLAKVLEGADLSTTELSPLLNTVATAVESFPVDDNSFYSARGFPAVQATVQLVQLARNKRVSPYALAHSFHDYLNHSLNGSHCSGNGPKDFKELVLLYESLNRRSAASDQNVEPLSIPTSAPPLEPHPDAGDYWLSPKGKGLLVDAKHTNFDDNWRRYTDADRKTPEWQDRIRHLLNDMDDWRPTDEPDPASYYHERCILIYRVLADLPQGVLYDRVVSVWIATFSESSLQWDNPAEWYVGVSEFLRFSKKDVNGPPPPAAIIPLKDSSNPYLHALGVIAEFLQ